jgi:hypothetical protein
VDQGVHLPEIIQADEAIDLRNLLRQLGPVLVHHAAGDHQLFDPSFLGRGRFQDRVDGLLFSLLDEAAGVDDHRLRLLQLRDDLMAPFPKLAEHDLAVDPVLGAAKTDHPHPVGLVVSFHERGRV